MTLIGHNIIHFEQLPSTNVHALELLSKNKPPEGTVISTDNQFAGKGQLNNIWDSKAFKNVTLSVILYPEFLPIHKQFALLQMVSLAVFQVVTDHIVKDVHIKWPNDIYIGTDKVAGILIQNQIQGKNIHASVVGIGINVNQKTFREDIPNPVSISSISKGFVDLPVLKDRLFRHLNLYYTLLKNEAYQELNEQYLEHLYLRNQVSRFRTNNDVELIGEILGTNESGKLRILIGNEIQSFGFKEIEFL